MYLPSTFSQELRDALVDQAWDKAISHLQQNPSNQNAMANWITDTFEAIQFLRSHLDLSYRILSVICKESPIAGYLRLENIYKIFKTRVLSHQENAKNFESLQQEVWIEQNLRLKALAASNKNAFIEYCLSKDEHGWTPLHWAASSGNISFFEMLSKVDTELLARFARVRNNLNMSPLYLAFSQGQVPVLVYFSQNEKLIFERFLEDPQGPSNTIVLFDAVKFGDDNLFEIVATKHTEMFVRLIQRKDEKQKTLLHWVAFKNRNKMAYQMFRIDPGICGKLIEMPDKEQCTPIHAALIGKNYSFIELAQKYFPNSCKKFLLAKEEGLMVRILETSDEDDLPLLSQITSNGDVELLEFLYQKDQKLLFQYLNKEEPNHNTPFTNAIEHRQAKVLEFFFLVCPQFYKTYLTVDYLNSICSDMPSKGAMVQRFCTEPIPAGILTILLKIYERNAHDATQEIHANLAKPHAQEFVKALAKSPRILTFLNEHEDVLTAWFEKNPAKSFLTHEERLDLLLQLPPCQVYNAVEEITVERCERLVANTIYVEGENFEVTEVLGLVQAQFGNHLNEENTISCCQEYFGHIKPKQLVAAFETEDTKDIIMHFLQIIPDPLFRVVIPLLEEEEFISFMENVHLVKQISYVGVATCSQKAKYLSKLESPVTDEITAWKERVEKLLGRILIGLEATTPLKPVVVQLNNKIKQIWGIGQGHLTLLAQNFAILKQIKKKLQMYEISLELQVLINTTLDPLIEETRQTLADLERLKTKIYVELARHPALVMEEAPQEFYCPISGDIMEDPVIDRYNHCYERAAIVEWLQQHEISPLNRQPLTLEDLRPNEALKARIQAFKGEG